MRRKCYNLIHGQTQPRHYRITIHNLVAVTVTVLEGILQQSHVSKCIINIVFCQSNVLLSVSSTTKNSIKLILMSSSILSLFFELYCFIVSQPKAIELNGCNTQDIP